MVKIRHIIFRLMLASVCAGALAHCGNDKDGRLFTATNPPEGFEFVDAVGEPLGEFPADTTVGLKSLITELPLFAFTAIGDVDFSNVTAGMSDTKSFLHFASEDDKAGIDGDVVLYIPGSEHQNEVFVCPAAASLEAVSDSCPNRIVLFHAETEVDGYEWLNTDRSGSDSFIVSADIDTFSTGGMGQASEHLISVEVDDLDGTVVLQNNGGDDLTIDEDGDFSFDTLVANGETYNVTVLTQPDTQTCSVSNGAGTVEGSSVNDISVVCSTNAYTVGGTISGLTGTVVLQNNGGDNLSRNSNDAFAFATPVAQGATYSVTILTHPNGQLCNVTNGSGTVGGSDVTNVQITCNDLLTPTITFNAPDKFVGDAPFGLLINTNSSSIPKCAHKDCRKLNN